jgi:hypothetical protein
MSFKSNAERYLDYLLPLTFVAVCSLLIVVSAIAFWFFVPFVLGVYFWRKYNFWVILGISVFLYLTGYFVCGGTTSIINIAFNLLVVGTLLGVAWFGEKAYVALRNWDIGKHQAITSLKKIKSDYFVYVVIAVFVVVIGAYFGALKSWPVGDDAYLHVGKALFVRNSFPNTNWYPNWYLGLDVFQTYPPAYYFMVALTNFITGVPITELIVFFLFFAMFLLGVAVYELSKEMGLPRYLSLGFSLAWLSLPIVWGETITGGAYLRSFAAPFYILSVMAAYIHVKSINNGKPSRKAFLSLIFVLSFAALLHEMVGFFGVATVLFIYLLAVRGFKEKLKAILRVFISVAGLVSWWYLPLISYHFSYPSLVINDLTLDSLGTLSISITPILLPLILFLSCVFLFALLKNKQIFDISYEKKAFLIVFALLSLYFVLFAIFPMPANWYLMAAYDYAIWFGISLMLFAITMSSLFCNHFENIASNKLNYGLRQILKVLSIILVLLIVTSFLVSLSRIYISKVNPNNPNDWVYPLYQDLGYINSASSNNFRLTAITRRVFAMNEYAYPELDFAGGRQDGSYHAYYDDIFRERVLLRYHEDLTLYNDERLAAHSTVPYSMDNYYSSMFWMDWYGVNGILAASFEQTLQTPHGYYERPQFYNVATFSDGSTYTTYNESSPILVFTNAPVVGVIGDDTTYNALFQTLGELDINSQTIIPVKLETSNLQHDLQLINTVFVSTDQFQTYQTTLENYVKTGGQVVVMNYNPSSTKLENASLTQSGLTFSTYATPLNNFNNSSQILATTNQGAIITRSTLGTGFITQSSVSLQELYQDASPVASAILAAILLPNFNIATSIPQADNMNVNSTVSAAASIATENNQQTLEGKIRQNGQVIYTIPFENPINTSAIGMIQFELWNEGQPANMSLRLVNSKSNAYLAYNLTDSQWSGWNTFSIPLASFITEQDNSTLNQFNGIDLVLTNIGNAPTGQESYTLKMQNIAYYEIDSNSTYTPLTSNWKQPNLLQASTDNGAPARLLWKESYVSNWEITTDPKTTNITYFYAGPGEMLICVPASVNTIQFYFPLSPIEAIGIIISSATLVALAVTVTQRERISKLLKSTKKPTPSLVSEFVIKRSINLAQ